MRQLTTFYLIAILAACRTAAATPRRSGYAPSRHYLQLKFLQVAIEALIPVIRQSGNGIGVIGQLHFFLDDIFPNTLGRPIFANNVTSGRASFGR